MQRLHAIGYRAVLALMLLLPFDPARRIFFHLAFVDATALRLSLVVVAFLGLVTLVVPWATGNGSAVLSQIRLRGAALGLSAVLLSTAVSTIISGAWSSGVEWIVDMILLAVTCCALPTWIKDRRHHKVRMLARAFVAGAVLSAMFGLFALVFGQALDRQLTWWKPGPTLMGPYVRLSSTFSHANIAAMYFELALPFAVVDLVRSLMRRPKRWADVVLCGLAVEVLSAAILLTFSRGAWIGVAAAAVAMALASRDMWQSQAARGTIRSLAMAGAALGSALLLFLLPTASVDALRLSAESDATWYQARVTAGLPRTMEAGAICRVRATVTNQSPLDWVPTGKGDYQLSYHWLYSNRQVAQFTTRFTALSHPVRSGATITVLATVRAPLAPGHYLLIWDILWHNATWFGLKTGDYTPQSVLVLPSRHLAPSLTLTVGRVVRRLAEVWPSVQRLPIAQQESRRQLWSLALTMFRDHPFFGAGAHGFRVAYRSATHPPPGVAPARAPDHAHNLALELLVDWGIVGAGLWFLLAAWTWSPLIARAWHGTISRGWQLAALGAAAAFLAHGMVDYFLNVLSILCAIWILSALVLLPPEPSDVAASSPRSENKSIATACDPSR